MASRLTTGPLKIGDTLLKWKITALLGKGGHAWVYDGYDRFLDRHVAIKIIPPPSELAPERDLRERAQREARVLSKLENENVVRLMEADFTNDGAVYMVMEMLRGRTLREVIHLFGRLNVTETLLVGAKIANGVQAAHAVDVIHRDLKPENVFVIEANGIRVLDFGIAKLFGQGAATTQKELLHGTMKYMSPEHLLGLGVSRRSDIYALGTILYEALCGCIPCMIGMSEPTPNALTYAQINQVPPPLDEIVPSVPRYLARTIQRMLAKDPQDRFAEMAEVEGLLRAHLERYNRESNGTAPGAREMWRALPRNESASVLSHATTEVHGLPDLAPPTAPPVTLPTPNGQDTTPVSKPPFSLPAPSARSSVNLQVTQPMHAVATRPAPAPDAAPSVEPQPAMTPAAQASVPLSRAAFRVPPSAPPAPTGDQGRKANAADPPQLQQHAPPAQAPNRPRVRHREPAVHRSLFTVAIPVGSALGLLVGLVSYWPHAAPSSTEEPVVVVSAQPARTIEPPPAPRDAVTVTEQSAALATASSPAPSAPVAQAVLPAPAPLPAAPKAAAVTTAAPLPVAHATAKAVPKSPVPAVRSGLWDMSEVDTPTQPKPAPTAAKRQVKLIYGDDEVAR